MLYYYLHDHLCSNFRSPNTINKYFPLPQVKPQSVFPNIILNTRNSNSNSNGNSNSNHRGNQVAASGRELNLICFEDFDNFWRKMPTQWLQKRTNGSKNGPKSGGGLGRGAEAALGGGTRLVHLFDRYSVGPSIRPICTRRCFTMTNMVQVCSNFR